MHVRPRLTAFSGLVGALVLLLGAAAPAQAETRVALVIGNGAYKNTTKLANPRNDAADVAAALKRLGFSTIVGLDLDKAGMEDIEVRFTRAVRGADMAMVYYSGHAIQYAGTNYLLPVDARISDSADLRRLAKVDDIVADLQQAKDLRILVLDSCRDNPLADELKRSLGERSASVERGLARLGGSQGMIVAYSTQAGQTAKDGSGRNSPYTEAFLKQIETPQEISSVFKQVSQEVYEKSDRRQLPELSLSLFKDFYLHRPDGPAKEAVIDGAKTRADPQAVQTSIGQESADQNITTDCDLLAASPLDSTRPSGVTGVEFAKVDVAAATKACDDAVRRFPEVGRFIYQAGRVADVRKDYVRAAELYRTAIEKGSVIALVAFGAMYDNVRGFAEDPAEARRWYRQAADRGNAFAMFSLGRLSEQGRGTALDYVEAHQWYERAAKAGNAAAMYNLGTLYEAGRHGVARDREQARQWYQKAATAGDKQAEAKLKSFR
jgi:hypothetical protein